MEEGQTKQWPKENRQRANMMFFFRYHCQYFYRTWLYIWVTWPVSNKKQELLTLLEHMNSPSVFLLLLICLVFCVVLYVSLRS